MIHPFVHLRIIASAWFLLAEFIIIPHIFLIPAEARADDGKSSETYNLAQKIYSDIEAIRVEMGVPKQQNSRIKVSGVRPYDLYTQAALLFGKANRLAFEFTRHNTPAPPPVAPRKVTGKDANAMLKAVSELLDQAKKALAISEPAGTPKEPPGSGADDEAFIVLLNAGNIISKCMEAHPTSTNTFQTVTQSIGYASRLLEKFPEPERVMPDPPPFERGKTPGDGFARLGACLKLVESISSRSGLKMIRFDASAVEKDRATDDDVENIASIILSELAYHHSLLKEAKPAPQAVYPGRKFNSHVYQRAGILEAMLSNLDRKAAKNPRWLDGRINR